MSYLLKVLRQVIVVGLVLLALSALVVTVIRFLSDTDEARAAIARMEVPPTPADGDNAMAWIAFPDQRIPDAELPSALADDVAAYAAWHESGAERLAGLADPVTGFPDAAKFGDPDDAVDTYRSPIPARYPARPRVDVPDAACSLREAGCLAKVAADPGAVRAWLDADAERLALAARSLRAEHVRYPYAPGLDSPMPAFQSWRMPLNAVALQAAEGDTAGALAQGCTLLANARRLGAGADTLIAKLVSLALADGAASLVLDLVRARPGQPLPAECGAALAPVDVAQYEACEALRFEYRMNVDLGLQLQQGLRTSWNPARLVQGWLFHDVGMQRRWTAQGLGDACADDYRAGLARGEVAPTQVPVSGFDDPACYGAVVTCILTHIAAPAYGDYQVRMLDHAAKHRLLVALAKQAAEGGDDAALLATASSPGYALAREGDDWVLTLRQPRAGEDAGFRVAASSTPVPASPSAEGAGAATE